LEGQVLVLEKIVNQTYENERETYLLLVEEFKRLQDENTKMELQLHKFYEKIGEVDYLSGLVTKYKEASSNLFRSFHPLTMRYLRGRNRSSCWTCSIFNASRSAN
jgi:hypothetical protein